MSITDEPVRGQVPPAWFGALSGIDRLEAFSRRQVFLPPAMYLTGMRPAHISPGSGTWTMPASAWLSGRGGQGGVPSLLDVSHIAAAAMYGAALSTLPPGMDLQLIQMHFDHLRAARAGAGNFVARARVVNANRFFIYCMVEVEDAEGRQIETGTGFAELLPITPTPPPPPDTLALCEAPVYPTPDPCLRPLTYSFPAPETWQGETLEEVFPRHRGEYPAPHALLTGWSIGEVSTRGSEVRLIIEAKASEWLCLFRREVDPCLIATILNAAAMLYGNILVREKLREVIGLSQHIEILGAIKADGRPLRIELDHRNHPDGRTGASLAELYDADGRLVATHEGISRQIDVGRRRKRKAPESRRMLYTLLFTDVVGSTQQLARLGDAEWREILEEHHRRMRSEIARCGGTEIDTQGDGFFVKFSSPAQALECARSARAAIKTLGIDIRQGLHTGECEEQGDDLAGFAVHLASRIQGKAGAGEILVSSTVKELVAGSGLRFADKGEHELKGIEGTWRLWALEG